MFDCIHTKEDEAAFQEAMNDLENGETVSLEEMKDLLKSQ